MYNLIVLTIHEGRLLLLHKKANTTNKLKFVMMHHLQQGFWYTRGLFNILVTESLHYI